MSTTAAPIPNKTSRRAPIFPVEKNPAESADPELLELVGAVFGSPCATRIPLSLASWNQPPCVVMSKMGWPFGMYVQAPVLEYG